MNIVDTKSLDVVVDGKLRKVSLKELHRLIVQGKEPCLTKPGQEQLKELISILARIQVEGDWLLQSPWAIPNEYRKMDTGAR